MSNINAAIGQCSCGGSIYMVGVDFVMSEHLPETPSIMVRWECEKCGKKLPTGEEKDATQAQA